MPHYMLSKLDYCSLKKNCRRFNLKQWEGHRLFL